MMTFKEFAEYMQAHILEQLPESFQDRTVDLVKNVKTNNTALTGICIRKESAEIGIAPCFYLEPAYEAYQHGMPVRKILEDYGVAYLKTQEQGLAGIEEISLEITDFEKVKDKIGFCVRNAGMNRDMLKTHPHIIQEDLAKVYRIYVFTEQGSSALSIDQKLIGRWGISLEELDQIATENMPQMFPAVLSVIDKFLPPGFNMYMLTNDKMIGGASAMLYPGVLDMVREEIGCDFYILPSSTEEVFIVPRNPEMAKEYGRFVRQANREVVKNTEILSDCIYEYTQQNPQLRRVPESVRQHDRSRGCER